MNEDTNTFENEDSSNTQVEQTTETNESIDVDKLRETNRKLFERAKKAETERREYAEKLKQLGADDITSKQGTTKPSDILKADEFKLYREGYTEEEIDLIMHNGGRKALENEKSPLAMGLKIAREQRLAEDASGKTSDVSTVSDIERKYTSEQMRNMKTDDLAKLIGFAE